MSHPAQSTCIVDDMKCPHPGLSYNPTIEDHVSLLANIAEKESELQKHEAHINRVTQSLFKQVSKDKHEVILLNKLLSSFFCKYLMVHSFFYLANDN